MRKRPFLATGVASFFMAAVAAMLPFVALWAVGGGWALLAVVCAVGHRRVWRKSGAVLFSVLAVITLGFGLKTNVVTRQHQDYAGQQAVLTARVIDVHQDGDRLEVRVERGDLRQGTRLFLWAHRLGTEVREGDFVSGTCDLVAVFDAERSRDGVTAKANGIYLYAWPTEGTVLLWHDGQASMGWYRRAIVSVKRYISTCVEEHTDVAASLCKTMMMGERDGLSDAVKDTFRSCGIYHVLAVSGLHMSVLTGAMLLLLRLLRCPRRWRSSVIMVVVVLFMALCDFSPSVTRSGIMMLMMLSSTLFRRRAEGLNSLGLAATLMLMVDPFAIYDVGWQLSFAATLGLLCIGPVWDREITARADRLPRPVAAVVKPITTAVGVTVCATVATMPITAFWYGELSTVTLIGNLVLVQPIGLVLILSFVGVLVAGIHPWLSSTVFSAVEWLTRLIYAVAQRLSSVPWSVIWSGEPAQILWLFAAPFFVIMAYRWFRLRGVGVMLVSLGTVAMLVMCGARYWWMPLYQVRVAEYRYPTFSVRVGDEVGVVLSGDEESVAAAKEQLRKEGVEQANWVLWIDSLSTVRVAADTLKTERLILTADSSRYAALPQAKQMTVLEDGETVRLTDSLSLTAQSGTYRFEAKNASLLTAAPDGECPTEPTAYTQVDAAVLPALLPLNAESIRAEQIVLCGTENDAYRAWNRLRHDEQTQIHVPLIEGPVRLIGRRRTALA